MAKLNEEEVRKHAEKHNLRLLAVTSYRLAANDVSALLKAPHRQMDSLNEVEGYLRGLDAAVETQNDAG